MPLRVYRPAPVVPTALLCFLVLFIALPAARAQESTGAWSTVNTTNSPTERHENAFAEVNGKLYLIGGRGVKRVQIFNPATNVWTDGANPPFQMHHFQAVVRGDLIYIVGAYTGTCCDSEYGVDHVYYYNTANNTWNESHEVPANRRRGSAGAVLHNDKIYLVGGIEGGHGSPASGYTWFDEYDPVTGQWKVLPDAPRKRDHAHAVVYNNKLYLTGGRDTSNPKFTSANIGEVDIYNFATGTWSTLSTSHNLPTLRGGTTSVLYNGEILVMGGESSKQTLAHDETEAFDPVAQIWRTLAPLNVGRHGTQAVVFDNAVFIAAGSAQQGGAPELDSIERFDNASTNTTTVELSLRSGWNLMGLPLDPVDRSSDAVFADVALSDVPMTWGDAEAYIGHPELSVGTAYWVHVDGPAQTQNVSGQPIDAIQIPLESGWNMIAGPTCDDVVLRGISTDPVASIVTETLYGWDDVYTPAYTTTFPRGRLDQGVGYWVFANKDALLTLDCGTGKMAEEAPAVAEDLDAFHHLDITDAGGRNGRLFFGAVLATHDAADSYRLPPRPDARHFDVRFSTNSRLVETPEAVVRIQSSQRPFQVRVDAPVSTNARYRVEALVAGQAVGTYAMQAGEGIQIDNPYVSSLRIALADAPEALHESALPEMALRVAGSYPNPFADHTTLRYDLHAEAHVRIEIFDALGRRVHTIERQDAAGAGHEATIESASWPAGLYLYRIEAASADGVATRTGRLLLSR
ncbi:MAG: kelch repeat-containing protein [Rhodothermales bacterium]|nr:kelch repeat-containing protein [Rhodothermales bacterium]